MQYLGNTNSKEAYKLENDSSAWCTLSINEIEMKAKIKHMGRGKFKILADENGGEYTNIVVDASDVFHCKQ
ncbi:MAG: hypothetical protein WBX01_08140 [Nitrososphaeraceae archaeon]